MILVRLLGLTRENSIIQKVNLTKKSYLATVPSFKNRKEKEEKKEGKRGSSVGSSAQGQAGLRTQDGGGPEPHLTVPSSPSAPPGLDCSRQRVNCHCAQSNMDGLHSLHTGSQKQSSTEKLCATCSTIKVISFIALFAQPESEYCLVFIRNHKPSSLFFFLLDLM